VIILMIASLVTAIFKDPTDALVIFGVVLINAIPEGLPAALTVALSIGVSSMARHRAIIHF
jgi:magnesium-transporting ATPase (P-type)